MLFRVEWCIYQVGATISLAAGTPQTFIIFWTIYRSHHPFLYYLAHFCTFLKIDLKIRIFEKFQSAVKIALVDEFKWNLWQMKALGLVFSDFFLNFRKFLSCFTALWTSATSGFSKMMENTKYARSGDTSHDFLRWVGKVDKNGMFFFGSREIFSLEYVWTNFLFC